jgi:hypothetical protein
MARVKSVRRGLIGTVMSTLGTPVSCRSQQKVRLPEGEFQRERACFPSRFVRPMTLRHLSRAAALSLLFACGDSGAAPKVDAWHSESGYRWRALDVRRGTAGFTALKATATGIAFENAASDKILKGNRVLGQGGGVSLGDVDGDGLVDVFLSKTEGCNALYRNLGGWKFEEVAATAGVAACERRSTGSALADLDGDSDLDLVLLATNGPNAVFVNDGKGTFTERRDLGLDTTGRGGTTVTLADVDGSGRLAMYVANYKPYFVDDTIPPQERAFNQMVREVAPKKFEVVPAHRGDYKLVTRVDMGGMRLTQRAEPDELYLNDGKGRLQKTALKDGRFLGADGRPLAEPIESFTLGARFADLNGDGAPDLYVANDFEDVDELWFNDGKGRFRIAPWSAQRQISNSTMGIDIGDVNGDGLPDLFCVDMLANDRRRLLTQIPTNTAFPKKPGEMNLLLQHQRNTLFINQGDETFTEVAQFAGVAASGWSWGTVMLDVDLDGWQDILVANGHLWDVMDADVQEGVQNRLQTFPWQELRWKFPKLALPNVAFRNRGNLTFEDAGAKWGFAQEPDVSHGMAVADLDGDGDLDVVVNRLGAPASVLRNNAPGRRVAVRLSAAAPNTRAIGARVRLLGGATPIQAQEVKAGGLYMSHSDYLLSFAMGTADSATLDVSWRDGRKTSMVVRANREYEVTDATGTVGSSADTSRATPLFADATADLGGHTHTEPEFDDWGRQFLLPDALSTSGPGVSWFDADGDGIEELFVGAGKGARVAQFRSTGGQMRPSGAASPSAPADLTGIVGLRDDRGTKLLAGVSTMQATTEEEIIAQPAVLALTAARADEGVGSHASSTGPIAVADYDGDGRLDLFVGSRAIPMKYPLPASSGLFRNVDGKFVFDTANAGVMRDVGMVTAAAFADINGDGRTDLVLAREWNSVLLLLNDGRGRLAPAPNGWGLGRLTSRWNGIAVGDLNGDGRLDLIGTSWGRNTPLQADSANPLLLYHGPIGARGEEEMLLARNDPRVRGAAPMQSYARARVAVPSLAQSVGTFAVWADGTIEKSLGSAMGSVSKLAAVTLDQTAFFNRGDHFEARALPREAQFAPAFYAGVADFNGDGSEDVFLAQNFSQTLIGWPRADAGRGLLLTNDGTGALRALSANESGIRVFGDQRGAAYADYDRDGRLDLAVSQNAAATRLFHNRMAKPGLRVRLRGVGANPDAIGAQVRLVYASGMGPVREVQAGAGYLSQNAATQVFGLRSTPTHVWVRWPGGAETREPVPAGANELVIRQGSR